MLLGKGCLADPVDKNDFLLGSFIDKDIILPDEVDYSKYITDIKNQGVVPSCVGYGTTRVKEILDNINNEFTPLSPIWLYDQCKRIDGDSYGGGTYIRLAVKILAKQGCAPDALVNYDGNYHFGKYKHLVIDDSNLRPYRIKTYARLLSIDDMLGCLAQHGPFSMGVEVTDTFEKAPRSGLISMDYKKVNGGHCIACIGYSIPKEVFYIVNSWTADWANKGFASLPFEYIEKFAMDAWGIVDVSPNEV